MPYTTEHCPSGWLLPGEHPVCSDAGSSLYPEGFSGIQTPHLQGIVPNIWMSRKTLWGRGWLIWQQIQHWQTTETSLAGEGRGRPGRKAGCSAWEPTAVLQPCPWSFSCQLSVWPCLGPRAVCASLWQAAQPPGIAFAQTGGKAERWHGCRYLGRNPGRGSGRKLSPSSRHNHLRNRTLTRSRHEDLDVPMPLAC